MASNIPLSFCQTFQFVDRNHLNSHSWETLQQCQQDDDYFVGPSCSYRFLRSLSASVRYLRTQLLNYYHLELKWILIVLEVRFLDQAECSHLRRIFCWFVYFWGDRTLCAYFGEAKSGLRKDLVFVFQRRSLPESVKQYFMTQSKHSKQLYFPRFVPWYEVVALKI